MGLKTKQTVAGIRLLHLQHHPQQAVCVVLDYNASPMTHVRLHLVLVDIVLLPHAAMVYSTKENLRSTAVGAIVNRVQLISCVQPTPIANL